LCAFGKNAKGKPWTIGIANPNDRKKNLLHLDLSDRAIATSGDYEQFFNYQGKRYSHSLNPKTGLPLSGIKSVSVISPSAELSDGLATAVYTLGEKAGISFVNSLPQTHAIVINENNEVHFSEDINYEGIR
jgi:thiamine biosynthesis lipoprotein